jgi:hypothetical protein
VKTRDHDNRIVFDDEHHAVREPAQEYTPHIREQRLIAERIALDFLQRIVKGAQEIGA